MKLKKAVILKSGGDGANPSEHWSCDIGTDMMYGGIIQCSTEAALCV